MNKILAGFIFAGKGIRTAFISERNLKIQTCFVVLVILSGWVLHISIIEWLICFLCFGLVIGAELMNTSVEKLVDLASPQFHPLAEKVKDIAAGAVLFNSVIAAIIGLIIFVPKIWEFIVLLI
ncbi:MAG TPA: diacylglycerol kinase family protein [Paludibacteraceae bacterium]|mgnify:FL=1|nr:diacylglycerol kinase family protein [Porphyromonadaceae sp. NP-X]HNZ62072.1 diacylglycerol kinase family protein [Paludibacteraceae bacterium]HOH55818.1 diacylglycerol kinase family protein [Paludibacteraceae bacterium]